MLNKIAEKMVRKLDPGAHLSAEQYETCIYGAELIIYTLLSTAGLVIVGFMSAEPIEAILIIFVFYVCQTLGGGKHLNTHMQCFTLMATFLFVGLVLLKYIQVGFFFCCSGGLAVIYLLHAPVVLHKHKQFLTWKQCTMNRNSRICTIFLSVVSTLLYLVHPQLMYACCIGLSFSAISRWAATFESGI